MNKDFHLTEVILKENLKARIYDNCLPLYEFEDLQEKLLGASCPWHYNSSIVLKKYTGIEPNFDDYDYDYNEIGQFTHVFFMDSGGGGTRRPGAGIMDSIFEVEAIAKILNPRGWLRIKANLGTKDSEHMIGGWHYDLHWPEEGDTRIPYDDTLTAVFYLNTNNGYTLLETGHKVESVENRLVIFPNNVLHTGVSQTDTNVRVLINFDFWL